MVLCWSAWCFLATGKKVGPSFLSLFGLQAAEFDLASPEGASKVNLSREKAN